MIRFQLPRSAFSHNDLCSRSHQPTAANLSFSGKFLPALPVDDRMTSIPLGDIQRKATLSSPQLLIVFFQEASRFQTGGQVAPMQAYQSKTGLWPPDNVGDRTKDAPG
jgi:hypothetical protein